MDSSNNSWREGCSKCGFLTFKYDSYFSEYVCQGCGWTTNNQPSEKIKIIESSDQVPIENKKDFDLLPIDFINKSKKESKRDTYTLGYWAVVNRQTVAKDIGQAFLSGTVGMAAPFLVNSSKYAGNVGFFVVYDNELIIIDYGLLPLEGVDGKNLRIPESYLKAILESEDHPTYQRFKLRKIASTYFENQIEVEGECKYSVRVPDEGNLEGFASVKELSYAINEISDILSPDKFIRLILERKELPSTIEIARMAKKETYMNELFKDIDRLKKKERLILLNIFKKFPDGFKDSVVSILKEKSFLASKPPIYSTIIFIVAFIGVTFTTHSVFIPPQHKVGLIEGVTRFAIGLLSVCGFIFLPVVIYERKKSKWYKNQLLAFIKNPSKTSDIN